MSDRQLADGEAAQICGEAVERSGGLPCHQRVGFFWNSFSALGAWRRRWLRPVAGGAAVALIMLLATATGPLRSAVQIGGDEMFEASKALLWLKGVPLYKSVWNDQPPLHTAILTTAFKCFGPTIQTARCIAVGFGLLMLAALFLLVRKRCGSGAACIAAVCLIAAPEVLVLGTSAMLEAPAIGVALWALWPIYRWQENRRWPLLLFSGVILACALQMKFTAAVVAPALAAEVLLGCRAGDWKTGAAAAIKSVATWGGSTGIVFFALGGILGGSYDLLWASHFSGRMMEQLNEADARAFSMRLVAEHTEGMWGMVAALVIVAWKRDWRRLAFPVVMLTTVFLIHMNHRPWWSYYYLHFAVPLAWLSGYAVAGLLSEAFGRGGESEQGRPSPLIPLPSDWRGPRGQRRLPPGQMGSGLAASVLITMIVMSGGSRLLSTMGQMASLPRIESSQLLAQMKRYAPQTHWVYTSGGQIFAFHARLPVIPDLAVVVAKRIWSGRIDSDRILKLLRQYEPEQMVVEIAKMDPAIESFAEARYAAVYEERGLRLYVAKEIARTVK